MIVFKKSDSVIVGVFKNQGPAGDYLSENSKALEGVKLQVVFASYPIYVFQDHSEKEMQYFISKEAVVAEIKRIKSKKKSFDLLVSIVKSDWSPKQHGLKANEDAMGYLDHSHISRCRHCGKIALGVEPFEAAFTKAELKADCECS